jgi:flagellar biosynthesis protein FlhB
LVEEFFGGKTVFEFCRHLVVVVVVVVVTVTVVVAERGNTGGLGRGMGLVLLGFLQVDIR